MATVRIAGRDFEVFDRQADGGLGLLKGVALAEVAVQAANGPDVFDRAADRVAAWLVAPPSHDELMAMLPADCSDIIRACIVASGGKVAVPEGEAKST
jgi:hypothetical protein